MIRIPLVSGLYGPLFVRHCEVLGATVRTENGRVKSGAQRTGRQAHSSPPQRAAVAMRPLRLPELEPGRYFGCAHAARAGIRAFNWQEKPF